MTTETILTYKEISKTLVDEGILLVAQEITGYDLAIARAIEQAVLQSEQVQAWKRDAERIADISYRMADAMLKAREEV